MFDTSTESKVGAALGAADRLLEQVQDLVDAIDRGRAVARAQLGLSPLEYTIVRALSRGDHTISSLARHLGANRSSISMAVQRLERRAVIVRVPGERTSRLEVTDEMRRQYEALGFAAVRAGIQRGVAEYRSEAYVDAAADLIGVIADAVDQLQASTRARGVVDELHDALRRGDVERSSTILLSFVVDGCTLAACEAVAEVMHRVGDAFARGEITIADERVTSNTAARSMDRLRAVVRPSTRSAAGSRRALVATPTDEHHLLGVRLVTDELERLGWAVDLITGDLPIEDVVDLARRAGTEAAFVGVTMPNQLDGALALVRALATVVPVYVGGQAVEDPGGRAEAVLAGASDVLELRDLMRITAAAS